MNYMVKLTRTQFYHSHLFYGPPT